MNLITNIIPVDDMNLVVEFCAWCCVQVTLFTTAVAGVYGLTCRQRASRNVFLLAGGLAVVGLLTMACVSPWPRWNVELPSVVGERAVDSPPALDIAALPIKNGMVPAPSDLTAHEDEHVADSEAAQGVTAIAAEADPLPAPDQVTFSWWFGVVLAAWIAVLFGLARLVVGLACVRWHCRKSVPIDDADTRKAFDELCGRLGVTSPVELCESPSLEVAATIGWRRPVILLPSTWRAWSPDQRRAVLAHELAHAAERHVPLWLVSQVATVPHFYHPLVHWLGRRLRLEQEIAADQLAARLFGSRHRYCAALAGLALGPTRPGGPIAGLGLFMSRPLLMRRIAMLRKPIEKNHRPSRVSYIVGLALVALAAVGVAGLRAASPDSTEPDEPPYVAAENNATTTNTVADNAPSSRRTPVPGESTPAISRNASGTSHVVTALIRVSRQPPSIVFDSSPTSDSDWQTFCRTQLALLRSHFMLQAAMRVAGIADLPLVRQQPDPVEWLRIRLDVGFLHNSEIMYIRLAGTAEEADQLKKLVDAVVEAYKEKVIFAEDQRRQILRDSLARSLMRINRELAEKMEVHFDLSKHLGVGQAGRGQIMQQLDMQRLDRVDAELMRLEERMLEAEIAAGSGKELTDEQEQRQEFFRRRVDQLHKRQVIFEERIKKRSEESVDLTLKQRDLDQLQSIAKDMSKRLEVLDVERFAPQRMAVVQPATVSRVQTTE